MKRTIQIAALMLAGVASTLCAEESKTTAKPATDAKATTAAKGEKPEASPGWIIIEEDWYFPLRFDSLTSMNNARMQFRAKEEKSAAGELRKAVSWLKFAEGHAQPITKTKLTAAVNDLTVVAKDLEEGRLTDAASLDMSLSKASSALAEWHYFKAKESWGKNEEKYAAEHLQAAVAHLKNAANSAHYQYGADTMTVFSEVTRDGVTSFEADRYDHNLLGKHIDAVESAVKEMGDTLMKVAK